MTRLKIILTLFSFNLLYFTSSYSQSLASSNKIESQYEQYVDTLFAMGNHGEALKEYLRIWTLDRKSSSEALPAKIALTYRLLHKKEQCLQFLDAYYYSVKDAALKNKAIVEKILVHLEYNETSEALIDVMQLSATSDEEKNQKAFYLGFCRLMANDYKKGLAELEKLNYLNETSRSNISSKITKLEKLHKKNTNHAMIYSAFVPGLGQAINGEVADGVNSFLLIGGLSYLFIDIALSTNVWTAVMGVMPWYMRYSMGGVANAKKAAEKKKLSKKNILINEVLDIIVQSKLLNAK